MAHRHDHPEDDHDVFEHAQQGGGRGDLMYCPRCSQDLHALHCKVKCANCGYFYDCSDVELG